MGTCAITMSVIGKELGEILLDNGLLNQEGWQTVKEEYERTRDPFKTILSRLGLVSESQLKDTLELQYGVNYFSLSKTQPDREVQTQLPESLIVQHRVMPVALQGNSLTVAMVNPDDQAALSAVKAHLGDRQVKAMVCTEDDLVTFIDLLKQATMADEKQESKPTQAVETVEAPDAKPRGLDARSLFGHDEDDDFDEPAAAKETEPEPATVADAPAAKSEPEDEFIHLPENHDETTLMLLANDLIARAIERRCSDMHVEPDETIILIRYLKNTELISQKKLPKKAHEELVFCYKVMAGLNIAEQKRPQDRRSLIKIGGEDIELRVTTIPGEFGETVAITFKYIAPTAG
ncbi:MAG TPA: ATPase, T2SS/T4P/T4SS family [Chroococcales cyanobacterium]